MSVLKIATAGSVDDGKSTLIGRLLYDTQSLTDDKLEAIASSSKKKGYDYLDFSLATDGLVAEREQGITIDVAHIYFSTINRSFIIADTPGHTEYTRNMVTGASNAHLSIILIDARKGVTDQTKRHYFINSLLEVKHIIVAINKMDLVDFRSEIFESIKAEFQQLSNSYPTTNQEITFIPLSALNGDNVVSESPNTPWYTGNSLLQCLEKTPSQLADTNGKPRFFIQHVIRPKKAEYHDYRGFSGKLTGGNLTVGDEITVLPSLTKSRVKSIDFFDQTYDQAQPGSSITITLEDEVNASRGDMFVKSTELPSMEKVISAKICWMDRSPLALSSKYILRHGTHEVLTKVDRVYSVINTDFSGEIQKNELALNEIGKVDLKLNKPLYFDAYSVNKTSGSFILIDPQTNNTSGVGFIQ
jgi:sulfate adenylyltransferase subunit 1